MVPLGKKINRYIAYPDGTALDTVTGLTWMRCALGQTWDGQSCQGKAEEFKWEEATQQRSHFAGHSDWRIPTFEELRTLVYCSNGKPAYFSGGENAADDSSCAGNPGKDYDTPTLVEAVFPNSPDWFWSSSPYAYYSAYAWYVSFDFGYVYNYARSNGLHVRLVRGGQ